MTTHIGTCKLCLSEEIELQESHIIPKWAYKQVRGDSEDIVRLNKNVTTYLHKQWKVPLLCCNCEQKFGVRENYVRTISFDSEGQSKAINLLNYSIEQSNNIYKLAVTEASKLNRNYIAYFAASVIWRTSTLSKSGDVVSLGSYQEELRKYLNEEAGFPKEASLLVYFQDPYQDPNYHQLVSSPVTERCDKFDRHEFLCAGVIYRLFLGRNIPDKIKNLCLIRREDPIIIWTNFHNDPIIDRVIKSLSDAESRGRLNKVLNKRNLL